MFTPPAVTQLREVHSALHRGHGVFHRHVEIFGEGCTLGASLGCVDRQAVFQRFWCEIRALGVSQALLSLLLQPQWPAQDHHPSTRPCPRLGDLPASLVNEAQHRWDELCKTFFSHFPSENLPKAPFFLGTKARLLRSPREALHRSAPFPGAAKTPGLGLQAPSRPSLGPCLASLPFLRVGRPWVLPPPGPQRGARGCPAIPPPPRLTAHAHLRHGPRVQPTQHRAPRTRVLSRLCTPHKVCLFLPFREAVRRGLGPPLFVRLSPALGPR